MVPFHLVLCNNVLFQLGFFRLELFYLYLTFFVSNARFYLRLVLHFAYKVLVPFSQTVQLTNDRFHACAFAAPFQLLITKKRTKSRLCSEHNALLFNDCLVPFPFQSCSLLSRFFADMFSFRTVPFACIDSTNQCHS